MHGRARDDLERARLVGLSDNKVLSTVLSFGCQLDLPAEILVEGGHRTFEFARRQTKQLPRIRSQTGEKIAFESLNFNERFCLSS